jgi:hypothetical protein
MELDSHRKIPLNMCYNCGYIEGRTTEGGELNSTNFTHLKGLNLNETSAFLANGLQSMGLDVDESVIADWLLDPMN